MMTQDHLYRTEQQQKIKNLEAKLRISDDKYDASSSSLSQPAGLMWSFGSTGLLGKHDHLTDESLFCESREQVLGG